MPRAQSRTRGRDCAGSCAAPPSRCHGQDHRFRGAIEGGGNGHLGARGHVGGRDVEHAALRPGSHRDARWYRRHRRLAARQRDGRIGRGRRRQHHRALGGGASGEGRGAHYEIRENGTRVGSDGQGHRPRVAAVAPRDGDIRCERHRRRGDREIRREAVRRRRRGRRNARERRIAAYERDHCAAVGGAGCGEKLRTAENGPGTPAVLIPRTRQKWVVVARPVVAYMVSVVVTSRTSGAANELPSSIWISYDTALVAPFQSNVIGCGGVSALAGETSVTIPGVAGGATCAFVAEFTLIFVTKASPQKIDRSPFQMVSNAPVVAGKSRERVWPVRYTWPVPSRAMSSPTSVCDPPRKVE